MATNPRIIKMVQVPLKLEDWKRLRLYAAKREISMARLIAGWCEPHLSHLKIVGATTREGQGDDRIY